MKNEEIYKAARAIKLKYGVEKALLFGSYARGDATPQSDLDFLIYGGANFKPTKIFALAEDLRAVLQKNVDVFEISEVNQDSEFYRNIMREGVQI